MTVNGDHRDGARVDRWPIHREDRRQPGFNCEVTCAYCGAAAGRAFNVTSRWFYWTCMRCARTERIVLPTDDSQTGPASVILWRLRDGVGAAVAGRLVLRPGSGFELLVARGGEPIVSELFGDPNVLLSRSRDIRTRLLDQGCAEIA